MTDQLLITKQGMKEAALEIWQKCMGIRSANYGRRKFAAIILAHL